MSFENTSIEHGQHEQSESDDEYWHPSERMDRILDSLRAKIADQRGAVADSVRTMESLSDNELTLPLYREKYVKKIAEAKELLVGLDRELEQYDNPPQVREVETDNATFRIIYESHHLAHTPGVMRGLDAYVFEALHNSIQENPTDWVSDTPDGPFKPAVKAFIGADTPIIDIIRSSELPIYSCDVAGGVWGALVNEDYKNIEEFKSSTQHAVRHGASVLGTALMISSGADIGRAFNSGMTRREFTKTAIKWVAGTNLSVGNVSSFLDHISNRKESRHNTPIDAYDKAKYELFRWLGMKRIVIDLRNLVMAQKLHRVPELMREWDRDMRERPQIGMEVGKGHYRIEDALRMSEYERIAAIRKILEDMKVSLKSPDDEIAAIFQYVYSESDGKKQWLSVKKNRPRSLGSLQRLSVYRGSACPERCGDK